MGFSVVPATSTSLACRSEWFDAIPVSTSPAICIALAYGAVRDIKLISHGIDATSTMTTSTARAQW